MSEKLENRYAWSYRPAPAKGMTLYTSCSTSTSLIDWFRQTDKLRIDRELPKYVIYLLKGKPLEPQKIHWHTNIVKLTSKIIESKTAVEFLKALYLDK